MPDLYEGPIIDAHHHVWDLARNPHPWLEPGARVPHRYGDYDSIKKDYLARDFLADAVPAGVRGSVYMEAEWDPEDAIGERRYIEEQRRESGVPGAMAAQAWLDAPDIAQVLASHAASGIVRSVRHKPGESNESHGSGRGRTLMSDPDWREGYARLEQHGFHFELQTPWQNLPEAVSLLEEFPGITLVLNHSGVLLDRSEETLAGWRAALGAVADHPNVAIKASGLCVQGLPWTVALNREVVLEMIEIFGAERVMFGSNFPVDGMFTTYRDLVDGYREIVSELSLTVQHQFFFGTADRLYAPELFVS
ncbi:thioesterase [Brachybacterium ginsengisoli]|uniref:Thioesterase n=1 Tax=Brachybacterium ginsengisoli TaxID=1331682 RepID=A0A291H041_9MICO|nr:amidohydrolase family protein [Brachybacterium ginsengisoli]ATG55839.1 thioesterase [Brachybacterium ginsengisoli]